MINKNKVTGRKCGECTACCTIMGVPELEKPVYRACEHLCSKGCGIYNQRPTSCTQFECLWLQGHIGGEQHRPDKLGLMWTLSKTDAFTVWEVWEGATDGEKQQYFMKKMAEKFVFIIKRIERSMLLMGRHLQMKQFMAKHQIKENN